MRSVVRAVSPGLLLALLALAASPGASVALERKPAIDPADLAGRIHAGINEERKKHGLAPLDHDAALARIAAGHSGDMMKRKYVSHDSPEGRGFPSRYRAAGYACRVRVGNVIHGGAENIALVGLWRSVRIVNGVAHYDWNSAEAIARQALEGWMKSPGHRANILTPHWKREGIGVAAGDDGKVYITQNFC